jgi:hypothetical protein
MYSKHFIDLVKFASDNSEIFYTDIKNNNMANPYYVGFGNPSAEILIFGKEQGFDSSNPKQIKFESIENPKQWKVYVDEKKEVHKNKFYTSESDETEHYTNVFYPYLGPISGAGHTWNKYQSLLKQIYSTEEFCINDFLKHSFISEINYKPSKLSEIANFNDASRIELLKMDYYKSFKVTLLACGNYLSDTDIETIFDVKFHKDNSKPRQKLK